MDFRAISGSRPVVRPFTDRREAGRELAAQLQNYRGDRSVIVLALPRGGVPVAFEIAEALDAPMEIFVVRKLGMPGQPEFAIGAVASGGARVVNEQVIRMYRIPAATIERLVAEELAEIRRREREYRGTRPLPSLASRTVILVDDGLATGSTMRVAVEAVRAFEPSRVVVAVPVGSPEACEEFADITDETVCARTPQPFQAVGLWYQDFSQTTDDEVRSLIRAHADRWRERGADGARFESR